MKADGSNGHGYKAVFKTALVTTLILAAPTAVIAQQATAAAASLVLDGVTVVDVEHGKLVPGQRVVITGNRIQALGGSRAVSLPVGAQVVDAKGKYLIPGLWDMHVHTHFWEKLFYPLFLAYGVTGIRDAGTQELTLAPLLQWRREILAGTRLGPPRQILSGPPLSSNETCGMPSYPAASLHGHVCMSEQDSAAARQLVQQLKAAGSDMVKMYNMRKNMYFVVAAEARRLGIPFGGHAVYVTAMDASDSGVSIVDHADGGGGVGLRCWGRPVSWTSWDGDSLSTAGSVENCRPLAETFRRNNTWWAPTILEYRVIPEGAHWVLSSRVERIYARYVERVEAFWAGGESPPADGAPAESSSSSPDDPLLLGFAQRAGVPIVAGTDVGTWGVGKRISLPGLGLHTELELSVAEGLTALEALQAATLNPAKALNATDSLGTVAVGKLADLLLLDADPLANITHTRAIRAVVANGRYFDRAALDSILTSVRTGFPDMVSP